MREFTIRHREYGVPMTHTDHTDLVLRQIDATPLARNAIKSWARNCTVGDRFVHPDTLDVWERIA